MNHTHIGLKGTSELLKEFFELLDIKEESDAGVPFSPNVFRSCRIQDGENMNIILQELHKRV